jgi:hypothetical protein
MGRAFDSRSARRAIMRVTSYLLLVGQVLALGHLVLVPHGVCAVHGEALHVESGMAEQQGDEGAGAEGPGMASAPADEHGHHHCLIRATTRERFLLQPLADLSVASLLVPETPLLVFEVAPAIGVGVLSLAPKNSPPWV